MSVRIFYMFGNILRDSLNVCTYTLFASVLSKIKVRQQTTDTKTYRKKEEVTHDSREGLPPCVRYSAAKGAGRRKAVNAKRKTSHSRGWLSRAHRKKRKPRMMMYAFLIRNQRERKRKPKNYPPEYQFVG